MIFVIIKPIFVFNMIENAMNMNKQSITLKKCEDKIMKNIKSKKKNLNNRKEYYWAIVKINKMY